MNTKDRWGQTMLHVAAERGNTNIVRLLLEKGADINITDDTGTTALMNASGSGRENIVEILLQQDGIIVNIRNKDDITALRWARTYKIKNLLKAHGAH